MGFLARAGFDVFSMDMTGYGRSTRPAAMNDPAISRTNSNSLLYPACSLRRAPPPTGSR